jgi:hypothetical protein
MRARIYPKQVGRQVALLELAQFRGLDVRRPRPRSWSPRRCERPVPPAVPAARGMRVHRRVRGGIQASQSDEIRAPEWGDIEKGKVKAPRVGRRPAMRQVFKSISWRRLTRRAHEEVGTPNIS